MKSGVQIPHASHFHVSSLVWMQWRAECKERRRESQLAKERRLNAMKSGVQRLLLGRLGVQLLCVWMQWRAECKNLEEPLSCRKLNRVWMQWRAECKNFSFASFAIFSWCLNAMKSGVQKYMFHPPSPSKYARLNAMKSGVQNVSPRLVCLFFYVVVWMQWRAECKTNLRPYLFASL